VQRNSVSSTPNGLYLQWLKRWAEGIRFRRETVTEETLHVPVLSHPASSVGQTPYLNLTVEVALSPESLAHLKPDYERLCAITENTLPFALFDWHDTWCRHFLQLHAGVEEQLQFYVLRDPHGVCVAIFPFILSRRKLGIFNVSSIDLLGADPALTEIRGPLIEPGYERIALRVVRGQLKQLRSWDWVQWSTLNKAMHDALATDAHVLPHQTIQDFVLDLPSTWEAFRAGLKRNMRESLRHCYNSLKRDGLTCELVVVEAPEDVRAGLEHFLKLHRMRAAMQGTAQHPDRFASAVSEAFLYEVCQRLAERGVFRLFQLRVAHEIVAARIGFVVGEGLYFYYSGFDPRWAKYSVMTTTMAEAIKYAIRVGLKTVNLSPTVDVSKTRWGPRVVEYFLAFEKRDRLLSRIANQTYRYTRVADGSPARLLRKLIKARRRWD